MRKTCSKCEETRDVSQFSRKAKSKDGHAGICKICESDAFKRYYRQVRDDVIMKVYEWQINNPEKTDYYKRKYMNKIRKKDNHENN